MNDTELGELEAFRDFYAAAPPGLGARSQEIGTALCLRLEPLSTVTMFNRVLGLGVGERATEPQLGEALDFLNGVQAYVTVAPEAEPRDLGERLQARGLAPDRGWTKFSRSTDDPPLASTELRVERDEHGEAFAEAATRGFEVPELFLDWLRRLPAATAGSASSPSTARRRPRLERSSSSARSPGPGSAPRCRSSAARAGRARCWPLGSRPRPRPAARSW